MITKTFANHVVITVLQKVRGCIPRFFHPHNTFLINDSEGRVHQPNHFLMSVSLRKRYILTDAKVRYLVETTTILDKLFRGCLHF